MKKENDTSVKLRVIKMAGDCKLQKWNILKIHKI